ncbi:MAG: sensor histidine kinase [Verrucomicrobiota bacterium]
MAEQELHFKVSSYLKSIVGKDLITSDFVAIFELVKNSIDAFAKKIDVVFDLEAETPAIWIVDDGKGMTLRDLKQKWLFLGYSAKREGVEDEYEKTYAGNKGVGRFSCDRLGKHLLIQAKHQSSSRIVKLRVDWDLFEEDSKKEFDDVSVYQSFGKVLQLPAGIGELESGVAICISGLRNEENWTREKLLKLKSSLGKLINPFGGEKSSVKIRLRCEREKSQDRQAGKSDELKVNGAVENDILDLLEKKTSRISLSLYANGKLKTELRDRGELIYEIEEKSWPELGILQKSGLKITMYYLNRAAKQTFARRMGLRSLDFGSLFLFRNDFQVFPVGEYGDDYWRLDRRRAQGHSRFLGNRDIMGRVDVYGDEEAFRESSSRDKGLVETEEALAVKEVVLKLVKRFERYVVGVVWKDKLDKDYESPERLHLDDSKARIIELVRDLAKSDEIKIIDYNRELVSVLARKSNKFGETLNPLREIVEKTGDPKLESSLKRAQKVFEKLQREQQEAIDFAERELAAREQAEAQVEELEEEVEEQKRRNKFLVLGGNRDKEQLEEFIHSMIYDISNTRSAVLNEIERLAAKKSVAVKEVREALFEVQQGIEKIIVTSRYLTRANFQMVSGKLNDDIVGFMVDHLTVVAPAYARRCRNILIEGESLEFKKSFSPVECGMVLDNLISNSNKARANTLKVSFSKKQGVLTVRVEDNGRGLSQKIKKPELVFERGYTTTDGSGIGLNFCKKFVEELGGSIKVDKYYADGFAVEMEIPDK